MLFVSPSSNPIPKLSNPDTGSGPIVSAIPSTVTSNSPDATTLLPTFNLPLSSSSCIDKKDESGQQVVGMDRWKGRNRRKLSEEGYKSLAIIVIFLAGVQAQVLSSMNDEDDAASQIVMTLFTGGLLIDVFAAIMSIGAARWFEMLTQEEEDYLQKCWVDAERGIKQPVDHPSLVDRWVSLSIVMVPPTALLGLTFFVSGQMVLVWASRPPAVKVVASIICCTGAFLAAPFVLKHNRMNALSIVRLKRRG